MRERRVFQRTRTSLGAQVAFNNRHCIEDCIVRDLSRNGARIVFGTPTAVPANFDLLISNNGSRRARIMWRTEKEAGLSFIQTEKRTVVPIQVARRPNRLETARDVLKRHVTQLAKLM